MDIVHMARAVWLGLGRKVGEGTTAAADMLSRDESGTEVVTQVDRREVCRGNTTFCRERGARVASIDSFRGAGAIAVRWGWTSSRETVDTCPIRTCHDRRNLQSEIGPFLGAAHIRGTRAVVPRLDCTLNKGDVARKADGDADGKIGAAVFAPAELEDGLVREAILFSMGSEFVEDVFRNAL